MSTNDEKIRETLSKEPIPVELEPENIKIMLDEKAPSKKRRNIKKTAARITAGAAACAVICGTSVYFAGQKDSFNKGKNTSEVEESTDKKLPELPVLNVGDSDNLIVNAQASYMSGASGYEEVYQLYKASEKKFTENNKNNYKDEYFFADGEILEAPVESYGSAVDTNVTISSESEIEAGGMREDEVVTTPAVEPEINEIPEEPATEIAPELPRDTSVKAPPEVPQDYTDVVSDPKLPEEPTDIPEEPTDPEAPEEPTDAEIAPEASEDDAEEEKEHSETYNQEEGVLEADIVKTDGKNIYYLYNDDYVYPKINVAAVDDGKFTAAEAFDIKVTADNIFGEDYRETNISVEDMYLYNDMLLVVGTISATNPEVIKDDNILFDVLTGGRFASDGIYLSNDKSTVFVSVYTTGNSPELVDTYYQEGRYNDVRISPDGYMYLVSNYMTQEFSKVVDEEQLDSYIPKCGVGRNSAFIPADDILMPEQELEAARQFECTIIGSLDLNTSGQITAVDSKALAGYTGELYSSASNLYTTIGWDNTEITRIAIDAGNITPAANGKVEGRIKDQFSMSEYGGYFRIATTKDSYEDKEEEYTWFDENGVPHTESFVSHSMHKRDNRMYVLDMNMKVVGSLTDFGLTEEIKSVNFSGNTAYVVTYEQTDPLFAIDLSDPTNPTIMDEFKILGYSTYMQQWAEGQLLGFGVAADENGIETGIKLTMFDNSDPYNLDAIDTYEMNGDWETYSVYSTAIWDRKALLVAPEKNLIGVPVNYYNYNETFGYAFFSFENGEFVLKGEINDIIDDYAKYESKMFNRAVYIGDYVYMVSGDKFISADIGTIEVVDEVTF